MSEEKKTTIYPYRPPKKYPKSFLLMYLDGI